MIHLLFVLVSKCNKRNSRKKLVVFYKEYLLLAGRISLKAYIDIYQGAGI